MTKHGWASHGLGRNQTPRFTMRVARSFMTALERTVAQAVTIFSNDFDEILNSKSEWGYPRIPRLMVEVGDQLQGGGTKRNSPCRSTAGQHMG